MKKLLFLCFAVLYSLVSAAAPDYRPKFDKTPYKGTFWTQVNPWWVTDKQRIHDYGGPNYTAKIYRKKPWGEAFSAAHAYGKLNFQIELHVPAPGYAYTMKEMMKQTQEMGCDAKFSIFLVFGGKKNLAEDIKKAIHQLEMLKEEFKSSPSIYRLNGCPIISVYTPFYFTPEEWGKVIPAVEAKCGKFIWLLNVGDCTTENKIKDTTLKYLPYFDGVSMYANWGSAKSQKAVYEILTPIMKNIYPQKIFEAGVQNAYANHFHHGGARTRLSQKYRDSWDISLGAEPDSIVLTNFYDHYENSMVIPCYERENFMLRYAQVKLAEWRKESYPMSSTPELVLTNYMTVMLGQNKLHFEVIGFPIKSRHKKVSLMLDVCDTSGKVLYSFPSQTMDLTKLSVEEYELPSEQFYNERGIVPQLRYKWIGRERSLPYNPMTLISPSFRNYWMFWARSTANTLKCNVRKPEWRINNTTAGKTEIWSEPGSSVVSADVVMESGSSPRHGWSTTRMMRNGLEFYRHRERNGALSMSRGVQLPSPGDALNWYHMELENDNGFRYQTLPVWVVNGKRSGKVRVPVLLDNGTVKEFEIEDVRVPYFYYPCDRDEGYLAIDRSGHGHNGSINGSGYGGGHLGFTGYYHYHNGAVKPGKNPVFARDENGKGMLKFNGKEYLMIMGGTAMPGAYTCEVEIQPASIGKEMGIIGTVGGQVNIRLLSDGRIDVRRNGFTSLAAGEKGYPYERKIVSKTKLEAGKWYKIAVVYDLKELKLYINGKLEGTQKVKPNRGQGSLTHVTVGSLCGWVFTPKVFFEGAIRNIRFYGRNLTEKEFLK